MSGTYNTATASARLAAVVTALGAAATLKIGTSALSGATGVLATISLDATPATVLNRVLTIAGLPKSVAAAATGTAAKAELRTGAGVVIVSGLTVGAVGSGCDIIVDTVAFITARNIYLLTGTITHP